MRILGIDPGLRHTGWGVVHQEGSRLMFLGAGVIHPSPALSMPQRLAAIAEGLAGVIKELLPDEAAVEETFVNSNARSALVLGQARGVALLVPAQAGLVVAEYAANLIKKNVTGYGHADKQQVLAVLNMLMPGHTARADAADALAIAVAHGHLRQVKNYSAVS
ncbi:MAG: crossover junction endodeoxyribonuclease RuvC [Alphaproteobacteria bacterium]|nr:crossover junction endodeoxyribonuclease RuvC [Alphaproteobacteria bacterium]